MLKDIGISQPQASHLMKISENSAIANQCNSTSLPTAARALYELSRLPADELESGIASGDITPDMTIKDAKRFARPEPESAEIRRRRFGASLNRLRKFRSRISGSRPRVHGRGRDQVIVFDHLKARPTGGRAGTTCVVI